ncbi:MAG: prepilin peptidase [Bdellovibrionales bacterium]|nr:prepilin peptidase [Bdellovibrionales bacterium]
MTIVLLLLFGLCIGSFLNVVIYRVPRKLSVTTPRRSFCTSCERTLLWWENIPVLSWLVLRGKCKECKSPISGRYPFVEVLTGFAAFASYLHFGPTPTALIVFAITASLIAITFIDLDFKIIPNVISFPGMTLGLLLGILSQYTGYFTEPVTQSAWDSLTGFLCGGGFFYVVGLLYYAFTKRVGLGGGDIKLLAYTGAALGVDSVIPTIFAGSLVGAVVGVVTVLIKGGGRHTEIPFGPWLSLGAIIYMFFDLPFLRLF